MKSVTIEQVMNWHPCPDYTQEIVEELFAGRDALTAADIVALDITTLDKFWALCQNEFMTDKQMHLLACDIAEITIHRYGDDPRLQAGIDIKRRWVKGRASDEEFEGARNTAWAAYEEALHTIYVNKTDLGCWRVTLHALMSGAQDAAWEVVTTVPWSTVSLDLSLKMALAVIGGGVVIPFDIC